MATNNAINYDISAHAATFSAYLSTTEVGAIGGGIIPVFPFDIATINENNVYFPTGVNQGYFIAPVSGNYLFQCSIGFGNLTVAAPQSVTAQITLDVNSSARQRNRFYSQPNNISSSNTCIINGVFVIDLVAGNNVHIQLTLIGEGGNFSDVLADVTTFSGYLIF